MGGGKEGRAEGRKRGRARERGRTGDAGLGERERAGVGRVRRRVMRREGTREERKRELVPIGLKGRRGAMESIAPFLVKFYESFFQKHY